jgi:aminopeptidase-like protein
MKRGSMDSRRDPKAREAQEVGRSIYELIVELFPICRSITGDGFRQTLEILRRYVPLKTTEVPSGTRVFDWTVPNEWNIRSAYIKNARGEKVVDFADSNLHVLNYSLPIHAVLPLDELKKHLFTLPEHPDWIPYRTSYYREAWGFCLSHRQYSNLKEGRYEVAIDSTLAPGSLTLGELALRGELEDEILISVHSCHPSLANDNLSGVATATMLARHLGSISHRYSYRFLFIPGTIGAITWLSLHEEDLPKIKHGLVITGVGDGGKITYKKSRRGSADIDRAACHVLEHLSQPGRVLDFSPYGYDERQYCSPAFNLPVGRISRTPFGEYPEYHTSADNLDFVEPDRLGESYSVIMKIIEVLENDRVYISHNQKCEPQLGKRGIYSSVGQAELALLWVLNLSDGSCGLLDIAERSGLSFDLIKRSNDTLIGVGLLSSQGH